MDILLLVAYFFAYFFTTERYLSLYFGSLRGQLIIFGLTTLALLFFLGYVFISYRLNINSYFFKKILLGIILVVLFLPILVINLFLRVKGELRYTHDSVIQTEAAVSFLLKNKNPYRENYLDTELASWNYGYIGPLLNGQIIENPALYHYIYLPFFLVISVPFYLLSYWLFSWFDFRLIHVIAFILSMLILNNVTIDNPRKMVGLILFANPFFLNGLIYGYNDVIIIALLLFFLYFLIRRKTILSSIFMSFLYASKQTTWLLLPLYFLYRFRDWKKGGANLMLLFRRSLYELMPALVVAGVVIFPFFIFSAGDFIDDIWNYGSGTSLSPYPLGGVRGIGFASYLYYFGFVKDIFAYFPFWILQLLFGLPIFIVGYIYLQRERSLSAFLMVYALLTFTFLFFSRYFHLNHFYYIVQIIIIAYIFKGNLRTAS